MDASFWLKLALSFIVGSLWVTITTLSAERFGSKVGGLIGGLPSTVVITLLFIGITQSAMSAAEATTVMPLAQGVNGVSALTFMHLVMRGVKRALVGSLLVWFFLATLLFLLDIHAFWISIIGWLLLFAVCYWVVERRMKLVSKDKLQISSPSAQVVWRALLGGAVIAWAVFMGKLAGPLLGGIFGSFPAMYLSNLVITSLMGGPEFSRSVGKSLLISGMVNVPLYEIMVRLFYPAIGLGLGTVLSLLVIMGTGTLTFQFMKTRLA